MARLLGRALDAGLNVIDTAECYLESEELIGRALGGPARGVSTCSPSAATPTAGRRADWRPASLLASIERSLRRLGPTTST